jgi:eukaryotic-like serine/threonine-protein kinase
MPAATSSPPLELAHVMFTDIVAFSRLPMEQQESILHLLQHLVRSTPEYLNAQAADRLITLPAGDGIALVFFGDPESPVRCAQELAAAAADHPELRLRIGVNSGPVVRVSDINANRNVTGGGINMAQRVMDCGDASHILVSKTTADFLSQTGRWHALLHNLGEAEVKHGVRVHLYNFFGGGVGNPRKPSKLRQTSRRRSTRRTALLGGVVAAVATIAAFLWIHAHRMSLQVVTRPERRSVAVLGFRNLSGKPDQAWLSTALAQMMSTELAAGQKLRTIPAESVSQARVEFGITDADSLAPDTLTKLKRRLDADLIVLGSYVEVGASEQKLKIRLDVHLQSADSGEVLVAAAEYGAADDLFDLVSQCGQQLRAYLAVGAVSAQQAASVRASVPSNPDAARFYSQGLERLHLFDALGARDLFQKAIAIEPGNAEAHAALSSAWTKLGYLPKAAAEAKSAMDLSANLPREDRLEIEGQYHQAQQDWPRTIQTWQTLYGFFPDNLEYGLDLAQAQSQGGRNDDSLATIAELRKLPPPARDDPRIDIVEAQSAEITGDSKRAAAANERAAQKAQTMGARLLYAQARSSEGWNYRALGDLPKSIALLQEAEQIFEQSGDRAGAARSLGNLGATYSEQGHAQQAVQNFQKSLAIDRDIGNSIGVAHVLQNLGFVSLEAGQRDQAKKYLEESLATSRSNGDADAAALTLMSLSDFYYQSDDPATAEKYVRESAETAHSVGNRRTEAIAISQLAQIQADSGNLATAKASFEQALAIFREEGVPSFIISALERLGQVEWSQGNFPDARRHLEEAAQISRSLKIARDVTIAESNLAELSVDEGHTDAAIAALNAVIADFRSENQSADDLITPIQYLAEAQLDAGKPAEARKTLVTLQDKKGQFPNSLLAADYNVAMVHLGEGRSAVAAIERLLADKDLTQFESRLEVRLSLAKAELAAGQTAAAHAQLQQLAQDASAKGYGLWSGKAEALLTSVKNQ